MGRAAGAERRARWEESRGGATGALGRITRRSDRRAGKNHEAERQARWPGTRSNTAQYIRIEGEK
ncbi:hypothetical protein C7256_00090 [Enterocloster lavalensis]|nr:hypothetical protein C7256_00090 [Enterocloster lavalensis]